MWNLCYSDSICFSSLCNNRKQMEYKLYSNIACPDPTKVAAETFGEGIHY